MALTSRTSLGAFVFAGTGAFNLTQLTERSVDPAIEMVMQAGAGQAAPSHVAAMSLNPIFSASTTEISRVLTNINLITGLAVESGGAAITSLTAYWTNIANVGVRGGASVHSKIATASKALVVPKQLSADQDGVASITLDVHVISADGTTAPWTYTGSVSLPATPVSDERFTLGPAYVNGSQIVGLIGMSYDFGLKVTVSRSDGNYYGVYVAIDEQNPKITLKVQEFANVSTFGLTGTGQGATASNIYLRKLSNRGIRVADATAEHIKFTTTASQGYFQTGRFGGSQNSDTTGEIILIPTTGAGGAIMAVNAAVAITT